MFMCQHNPTQIVLTRTKNDWFDLLIRDLWHYINLACVLIVARGTMLQLALLMQ